MSACACSGASVWRQRTHEYQHTHAHADAHAHTHTTKSIMRGERCFCWRASKSHYKFRDAMFVRHITPNTRRRRSPPHPPPIPFKRSAAPSSTSVGTAPTPPPAQSCDCAGARACGRMRELLLQPKCIWHVQEIRTFAMSVRM